MTITSDQLEAFDRNLRSLGYSPREDDENDWLLSFDANLRRITGQETFSQPDIIPSSAPPRLDPDTRRRQRAYTTIRDSVAPSTGEYELPTVESRSAMERRTFPREQSQQAVAESTWQRSPRPSVPIDSTRTNDLPEVVDAATWSREAPVGSRQWAEEEVRRILARPKVPRAPGVDLLKETVPKSEIERTERATAEAYTTPLSEEEEASFQAWYRDYAKRNALDPDPDNPQHHYDYRGAWQAMQLDPERWGPKVDSTDGKERLPSAFKRPGHPTEVIDGINVRERDREEYDRWRKKRDLKAALEEYDRIRKTYAPIDDALRGISTYDAFALGQEGVDANALAGEAAMGLRDWSDVEPIYRAYQERAQAFAERTKDDSLPMDIINSTAAMAYPIIESQLAGGIATAAAVASGVGILAAPTVYLATTGTYWAKQGTGEIFANLMQGGVDEDIARSIALPLGIPYAMIEQIRLGEIVPVVGEPARRAINRTLKDIMADGGKELVKDVGKEAILEEGSQEVLSWLGEKIGRYLNDSLRGTHLDEEDRQKLMAQVGQLSNAQKKQLGYEGKTDREIVEAVQDENGLVSRLFNTWWEALKGMPLLVGGSSVKRTVGDIQIRGNLENELDRMNEAQLAAQGWSGLSKQQILDDLEARAGGDAPTAQESRYDNDATTAQQRSEITGEDLNEAIRAETRRQHPQGYFDADTHQWVTPQRAKPEQAPSQEEVAEERPRMKTANEMRARYLARQLRQKEQASDAIQSQEPESEQEVSATDIETLRALANERIAIPEQVDRLMGRAATSRDEYERVQRAILARPLKGPERPTEAPEPSQAPIEAARGAEGAPETPSGEKHTIRDVLKDMKIRWSDDFATKGAWSQLAPADRRSLTRAGIVSRQGAPAAQVINTLRESGMDVGTEDDLLTLARDRARLAEQIPYTPQARDEIQEEPETELTPRQRIRLQNEIIAAGFRGADAERILRVTRTRKQFEGTMNMLRQRQERLGDRDMTREEREKLSPTGESFSADESILDFAKRLRQEAQAVTTESDLDELPIRLAEEIDRRGDAVSPRMGDSVVRYLNNAVERERRRIRRAPSEATRPDRAPRDLMPTVHGQRDQLLREGRETLSRERPDERPNVAGKPAPTFYSAAEEVVLQKFGGSRQRMTPDQWVKWISKQPGVKQMELDELDLETRLRDTGAKNLTGEQVADVIEANTVQIEEVSKSDEELDEDIDLQVVDSFNADEDAEDYDPELEGEMTIQDFSPESTGDQYVIMGPDPAGYWTVYDPEEKILDHALTIYEAYNIIRNDILEWREVDNSDSGILDGGPLEYGEYTTPGGENQRELLLTMPYPERRSLAKIDENLKKLEREAIDREEIPSYLQLRDEGSDVPEGRRYVLVHTKTGEQVAAGATPEAAKANYLGWQDIPWDKYPDLHQRYQTLEREKHLARGRRPYRSPHWEERNVVVHLRFDERTDAGGGRVMFIDEVQSDWGQEGRKVGYITPEQQQRRVEVEERSGALARQLVGMASPALQARFKDVPPQKIPRVHRNIQELVASAGTEEAQRLGDEIDRLQSELTALDEYLPDMPFKKNWMDLALKRAVRWAAENDFDRIAWTTGAMQTERYNDATRRAVDQIEVLPLDGGRYQIEGSKNGHSTIDVKVNNDRELADQIGEELAQRALDQLEGEADHAILKGDDLTIGGEGMKGFYDKMIPSFLSKYAKKWDARVEQTEIRVGRNYIPVHSLDITPSMRHDVLQKGQPLYERGTGGDMLRQERPAYEAGFPLPRDVTSPAHAQAIISAAKGDFEEPTPEAFVEALASNKEAASFTKYTVADAKKLKRFKLKGADVYFGLKRHNNYWGTGRPEVELTAVINNEEAYRGLATPAVLLKAIEEGATALEAFDVPVPGKKEGFLPDRYGRFGFKVVKTIPWDEKIFLEDHSEEELNSLYSFWEKNFDFDRRQPLDTYPPLRIMTLGGDRGYSELDRQRARRLYLGGGAVRQRQIEDAKAAYSTGLPVYGGESPGPGGVGAIQEGPGGSAEVRRGDDLSGAVGDRSGQYDTVKPDRFLQSYQALRDLPDTQKRALGIDPKQTNALEDLRNALDADPIGRYAARSDETPLDESVMERMRHEGEKFQKNVEEVIDEILDNYRLAEERGGALGRQDLAARQMLTGLKEAEYLKASAWEGAPAFSQRGVKAYKEQQESVVGILRNALINARNLRFSQALFDEVSADSYGLDARKVKRDAPSRKVDYSKMPGRTAEQKQQAFRGRVETQLDRIDAILEDIEHPLADEDTWRQTVLRLRGNALKGGRLRILKPPYRAIEYANNPRRIAQRLLDLTPEQLRLVEKGKVTAQKIRQLYREGKMRPVDTGLFMAWGALSPRLTPYYQEAGFLDAVNAGLADWVQNAIDGKFNSRGYGRWVDTAIPEGSPGRSAIDNLNKVGHNLLARGNEQIEWRGHTTTRLNAWHEVMSDESLSSQEKRRLFQQLLPNSGIQNKVLSFVLLVTGHDDVLVIDRVQGRELWDAANRGDEYTDEDIYVKPFIDEFDNLGGLGLYEALEQDLDRPVRQAYRILGRDGGLGSFHWESWVLASNQEVGHSTTQAILESAANNEDIVAYLEGKGVRQGKLRAFEYGWTYGLYGNEPGYMVQTQSGDRYHLTIDEGQKLLDKIKKPVSGVIPHGFAIKQTNEESDEATIRRWYDEPGVNRDKFDTFIRAYGTPVRSDYQAADEDRDTAGSLGTLKESRDEPPRPSSPPPSGLEDRSPLALDSRFVDTDALRDEGEQLQLALGTTARPRTSSGVETLASTLQADIRDRGYTTVKGQRIETYHDFAKVAQVFRDPRAEHYWFYITDAETGKILSHEDYSSGRTDATRDPFWEGVDLQRYEEIKARDPQAADRYYAAALKKAQYRLANRLQRIKQANGGRDILVYTLHNHPSGNSRPSGIGNGRDDIGSARAVGLALNGLGLGDIYAGHVIIDSNEYSVIDTQGRWGTYRLDNGEMIDGEGVYGLPSERELQQQREANRQTDPLFQPQVFDERTGTWIDRPVHSFADLAHIGIELKTPANQVTLMGLSTKNRLMAVWHVPTGFFKNQEQFGNYLRNQLRHRGAVEIIAYYEGDDADVLKTGQQLVGANRLSELVYLPTGVSRRVENTRSVASEVETQRPGWRMGMGEAEVPMVRRVAEDREKLSPASESIPVGDPQREENFRRRVDDSSEATQINNDPFIVREERNDLPPVERNDEWEQMMADFYRPPRLESQEEAQGRAQAMQAPGGMERRSTPESLGSAGLAPGENLFYEPISNDETEHAARNELVEVGVDGIENRLLDEMIDPSAHNTALAVGVLAVRQKQYDTLQRQADELEEAGDKEGAERKRRLMLTAVDSSVRVASHLSQKLTEAGQQIQAAKLMTRLTPASIEYYAQKMIDHINETMPVYRQRKRGARQLEPDERDRLLQLAQVNAEWYNLSDRAQAMAQVTNKIFEGQALTKEDVNDLRSLIDQVKGIVGHPDEKGKKPSAKRRTAAILANRLDRMETEGRKILAERGIILGAGPDPELVKGWTLVAAAKIGRGLVKFSPWKDAMVKDMGEEFEPHARKVYAEAQRQLAIERKQASKIYRQAAAVEKMLSRVGEDYGLDEGAYLPSQPPDRLEAARENMYALAAVVDQIKVMTGDRQVEAAQDLVATLGALEKASFARKLSTAQYIAHLFNVKTQIRNIVGNELFYRLERLSRHLASGLDYAYTRGANVAGKDKERVITWRQMPGRSWGRSINYGALLRGGLSTAVDRSPYWNGLTRGMRLAWKGISPAELTTSYDIPQGLAFTGKGKMQQGIEWLVGKVGVKPYSKEINIPGFFEKVTGAMLRGFDYAAYERARVAILAMDAQIQADERGLKGKDRDNFVEHQVLNGDEAVHELAREYGKYVTFQDDTKLSKGMVAFKNDVLNQMIGIENKATGRNEFGLGDLVVKYPKTPSNLLMRAIDYSPLGAFHVFRELRRPFVGRAPSETGEIDRAAVEMSLARTLMGTAGWVTAYILWKHGVLTGPDDDDYDKTALLREQTGQTRYQVNLSALARWANEVGQYTSLDALLKKRSGDILYNYNWLAPIGIGVGMAIAAAQRLRQAGEASDLPLEAGDIFMASMEGGYQAMEEMAVMQGFRELFSPYGTVPENIARMVETLPSQYLGPSILYHIRREIDPYKREIHARTAFGRAVNRTLNRLPFASELLPKTYKTLGADEARTYYDQGNHSWWLTFMQPGYTEHYRIDPIVRYLLELEEQTGETKQYPRKTGRRLVIGTQMLNDYFDDVDRSKRIHFDKKVYFTLSNEDKAALQRIAARYTTQELEALSIKELRKSAPEKQVKIVYAALNDAMKKTREWFVENRAEKYLKEGYGRRSIATTE